MGKYEEALERAKELHESGNALTKLQMEIVFPVLKESDDERIRKEIRNFLIDMECKKDWIAYLEKQKEQKPAEWSEEDEEKLDFVISVCIDAQRPSGCVEGSVYYNKLNEAKKWLKSLRPQPHWKPSDEQMEWLESAVRLSTDKPRIHGIIISLYEQLKRLSL